MDLRAEYSLLPRSAALDSIAIDDAKFVTLSHTSDHFAEITERARQLLRDGKAYMDDTPQEQMREEREQRANSKHRDDDAKQGLAMFERMCAGANEGAGGSRRVASHCQPSGGGD